MSITTYAELKTAVADFLNRDDLTSRIPTFISMAEKDMDRSLRHWKMQKRSVAEINSQYSAVPADWLETVRFYTTDGYTQPMDLIGHAELLDLKASQSNMPGRPKYYAMTAGQFEFYPAPDTLYHAELLYHAKTAALSDANTSNWVLADAPDAYLYGALAHTAPYLGEDARLTVWASLYRNALDGLNQSSQAAQYSGSGLRMKAPRSY